MSILDLMVLVAPVLPLFFYFSKMLDLKTTAVSSVSFLLCFFVYLWGNSFLAICIGISAFSVIKFIIVLNKGSFKKRNNENTAIVCTGENDELYVLYRGRTCKAISVGEKLSNGDIVRIEFERNGVLFVIKN